MSDSLEIDESSENPEVSREWEGLTPVLLREKVLDKAAWVLIAGLDAEDAKGNPDWRNRRDSAIAILDRVDGKPVESKPKPPKDTGETRSPLEEILGSPAACEKLAVAIDLARAKRRE